MMNVSLENTTLLNDDISTESETTATSTEHNNELQENYETFRSQNLQLFPVATVGALLNLLCLAIWLKIKKQPKMPHEVFLFTQLCIDFLCSISLIIYEVGNTLKIAACNQLFLRLCTLILTYLTIFNSSLLTIERYLSIVFPFWHRTKMTKTKAYIMFVGIIVLTCTIAFINNPFLPFTSERCFGIFSLPDWLGNVLSLSTTVVTNVLPFVIFVYCYMHMFVVVRKRPQKIACAQTLAVTSQQNTQVIDSRKNKVITGISANPKLGQKSNHGVIMLQPIKFQNFVAGGQESTSTPAGKFDRSVKNRHHASQPSTSGLSEAKYLTQRMSKIEKKLLFVALSISVSFFCCNIPLRMYFWMSKLGWYKLTTGVVWDTLSAIIYLNLSLDPIIYIFTIKGMRRKAFALCTKNS